MRVKLFETSWSVDLSAMEGEINDFLKTLPSGAVKHVTQSSQATRTGDTDQMEDSYLIAVWYEQS